MQEEEVYESEEGDKIGPLKVLKFEGREVLTKIQRFIVETIYSMRNDRQLLQIYYLNSKFTNVINVTIRGTAKGSDGQSLLKVITNDIAPNLTNEFVLKGRGTW